MTNYGPGQSFTDRSGYMWEVRQGTCSDQFRAAPGAPPVLVERIPNAQDPSPPEGLLQLLRYELDAPAQLTLANVAPSRHHFEQQVRDCDNSLEQLREREADLASDLITRQAEAQRDPGAAVASGEAGRIAALLDEQQGLADQIAGVTEQRAAEAERLQTLVDDEVDMLMLDDLDARVRARRSRA